MNALFNSKDGFFSVSVLVAALLLVTFQALSTQSNARVGKTISADVMTNVAAANVSVSDKNTIVITAKRGA